MGRFKHAAKSQQVHSFSPSEENELETVPHGHEANVTANVNRAKKRINLQLAKSMLSLDGKKIIFSDMKRFILTSVGPVGVWCNKGEVVSRTTCTVNQKIWRWKHHGLGGHTR